jgi:N-hydroxyarylamine O-acetyltransferase
MQGVFDLDAYFERIRYGGAGTPNFETLSGILSAHTESIPFENLDVLLGRPIKLDIESLSDKIVKRRRGGYCFEHVTLFAAAIEQLGFKPVRHTARATLAAPRSQAPRTHMFVSVDLPEGVFIVDPGFGGLAPRFLVPLSDKRALEIDGVSHWMVRDGIYWTLRAQVGDSVVDSWSSTMEPDNLVDFDLGNYYISTHPNSPFVNRLMLRSFKNPKIMSVMNRDVTVRTDSHVETFQLTDRSSLRNLVNEYLGFDLPEIENIRVLMIPEWQ